VFPCTRSSGSRKCCCCFAAPPRGLIIVRRCVLSQLSDKYNLKITHETLRIGVCDTLDELLVPDKETTNCFAATLIFFNSPLHSDFYVVNILGH
jgi:hypothetical protein